MTYLALASVIFAVPFTLLVLHSVFVKRGWPGWGVVAGCFSLPAALYGMIAGVMLLSACSSSEIRRVSEVVDKGCRLVLVVKPMSEAAEACRKLGLGAIAVLAMPDGPRSRPSG